MMTEPESEWDASNLFQKWTFSVANPILTKGQQKALQFEDMMHIPRDDHAGTMLNELKQAYKVSKRIWFMPRLMVALFRMSLSTWAVITFYTIAEGIIRIALPLVLIFLLRALGDQDVTYSYVWAGVISALGIVQTLVHHVLFYYSMRIGWKWKNVTTAFIYDGLFQLSGGALQGTMTGRMVNLISNDVSRFEDFSVFACFTWVSFIDVALILLILIYILDVPSAVAGVGSTLLFIPIMIGLAKKFAHFRTQTAAATDQRVRHISEIIDGIGSVKSYAWENPFFKLIGRLRDKEIHGIASSQSYKSVNQGLMYCTPAVVSFITFAIYWRLGGTLTIPTVFATISLLQVLRMSIGRQWTRSIETASEALACCERIQQYLDIAFDDDSKIHLLGNGRNHSNRAKDYAAVPVNTEIELSSVIIQDTTKAVIKISNTSYAYDNDSSKTVLKHIDFEVHAGEILTVVGPVGSGKSSLLSAILGEMVAVDTDSRCIAAGTTIAYCAQKPWIMAASVLANVTLAGQSSNFDIKNPGDIDDALYKEALDKSLLVDDLKRWPAFDRTEIGERGVSISGGQKARISLARAIYSDASLYVLDDPLSAVDAHVGKALMLGCIKGFLKEKKKAIVLVTHQLQYLKHSDKVLVLDKDGNQCFCGSHEDLMKEKEILAFLELEGEEAAVDDDNEKVVGNYSPTSSSKEAAEVEEGDTSIRKINETLIASEENKPAADKMETEEDIKRRQIIEVEEKQTGNISWEVYTKYLEAGGTWRGIFVFLLILFSQALLMMTDYWLRWWASNSFGDQDQVKYLYIFAILVFLCIVVGFLRAISWFRFTLRASSNLHQRCLWAVVHSPMRFFVSNPTGRILNRFAKDQNLADEALPSTCYIFVESFIYCISAIVLVCISIPWLIILMPFLAVAFFMLRKKYITSTREIKRIEATTRSPIYADFSATLDGLVTLRAYRLEDKVTHLFQRQIDDNGRAWYSFLMASRWLGFRLDMETSIILIFVCMLSVILRNQIDIGLIGFTLVYTMALSGLFQYAVRLSVEVETQMTSIERIHAYCGLPPEPGYGTTLHDVLTSENPQTLAASHANPDFKTFVDNCKGDVDIRKLTVTYRSDLDPVLRDISVHIDAGSKVGICGRTGSGKSSTLLALLRLNIVTNGDIQVDGRSILTMDLEEARSLISIIPQEPHLFSGSIRFNLDPFSIYTDVEIWEALKDAHIHEYISGDPLGLEYKVEEGGKNFSVGQRQLLSLARAILRRSKVILMDEVTASIDFKTDRLIQETIRTSPSLKSATIITVAHRLRTIADSDTIVVIDAGRLAELDAPLGLLQQEDSIYRKLAIESGEFDEIYRAASSKSSPSA